MKTVPSTHRSRTSSSTSPVWLSLRRVHVRHLAPDHQPNQLGAVGLGDNSGGHRLPVFEHGHPVGDLKNLIQPVGNVDDTVAFGAQGLDDAKQAVQVGAGQHGRWLIHNQDMSVHRQRFGDLNNLLLADRQVLDQLAWINMRVRSQAFQECVSIAGAPGRIDQPDFVQWRGFQKDIFRHREVRRAG